MHKRTIEAEFSNFLSKIKNCKNLKKCPKFDVLFLRDVMIAVDEIYVVLLLMTRTTKPISFYQLQPSHKKVRL